jgi:hypothetical protein
MNWNALLIADVCHVSIKLSWDGFSTLEGSSAFAESVHFKTLPICSARSFRSLHLPILLFYDFLDAYSLARSFSVCYHQHLANAPSGHANTLDHPIGLTVSASACCVIVRAHLVSAV